MKNKKGFTLIELLAVIVILGVIMFVAIPMVTSYIENAKKDAFADNAKMAIRQARNDLLSQNAGNCEFPENNGSIYLSTEKMKFEKAFTSPYGYEMGNSYVKVTNIGDGEYEYSYAGVDVKNNGIDNFTKEEELDRKVVKKNASLNSIESCN